MSRTRNKRQTDRNPRKNGRNPQHNKNNTMKSKQFKKIDKKNKKSKPNAREIKQLFEGVRKQSLSSISNSIRSDLATGDASTFSSVSATEDTVMVVNSAPTLVESNQTTHAAGKRRKMDTNGVPQKRRKHNNQSLIIIDDDSRNVSDHKQAVPSNNIKNTLTIDCSTPIQRNNKHKIQDLIISNFRNNNSNSAHNFNKDVQNLTREINRDSYVTIDLTECSNNTSNNTSNHSNNNTVIDLDKLEDGECEPSVTISNRSLQSTMSGDSNVTVVKMTREKKEEKVTKYINRIANLDSSGTVLESVMKKIFTGCNMVRSAAKLTGGPSYVQQPATQTVEDTYIKDVILGRGSRNSIGSNIYNPERRPPATGPRMIVIDGSNVAMEHGKGRVFSVKGLKICIDYFLKKGHVVKAFVPRFRCKHGKSTDPRLLDELERRGLVVYTPSREIKGRLVTSYDDRYIVQCAAEFDGVIVSGDNYRDLMKENPRWQRVIESQLLPFTWVEDMIMFPRDPLGRYGPKLEQFLKHNGNTRTNNLRQQRQ